MVVKRPKLADDAPQKDEKSSVELMEHLVKKSLDINPELRDGMRTGEVMDSLKQQALARSKTQPQGKGTPGRPADDKAALAERRKSTISFFCEQKAKEYEEGSKALAIKEVALRKEREGLQARVANELSDFLGMIAGGTDGVEAREVLRTFRAFLSELGVTDTDLLARAKKK
jgi:hypothetical protein